MLGEPIKLVERELDGDSDFESLKRPSLTGKGIRCLASLDYLLKNLRISRE